MKRTRLDQVAGALTAGKSRREVVLGLAAAAAGLLTPKRKSFASPCGPDDSQDVEFYDGGLGVSQEFVDAHHGPVGSLQWNADLHVRFAKSGNVNARRWCSGTLVADDLFLTAGYCLENRPVGFSVPRIGTTEEPISRVEIATNMHVDFNFQVGPDGHDRKPEPFAVIDVVEDELGDLPYAILRLEDSPGQSFGVARVGSADPPVGDTLCIIGHPLGGPKRVATGQALEYQEFRVFHTIDTEGGSGGSGILATPEGALVGVHTNGGCDVPGAGNNYGIRISALLQVSPILSMLAANPVMPSGTPVSSIGGR